MRKFLLLLLLPLFGCASAVTHIKGDDATITRSVQAEKVLFNTANTLFLIEAQQRVLLSAPFPTLHTYVQEERTEVPRLILTIRTYTQIYRETVIPPKPDILKVVARAEAVSAELQGWLTQVAIADIPPPTTPTHSALTTGNPYVDAAVQLLNLINTGLTIYQGAQAKATTQGVLIDADETLLHIHEDQTMISAWWQP